MFHIDSLKESAIGDKLVREFSLSLVRQLKGDAPGYLTFKEEGDGRVMGPEPFGGPIVNSAWFDPGVRQGGTILVGYFGDIQHNRFVEAGSEYVEDFAFIAALPRIPDVASVKPKIDQFLAEHPGKIHACVSTYLATCIAYSKWDDSLWKAYVEKNPLKLRGEAQSQMLSALADQLIGREFEVKTDPGVRASRTNKVTAELVAQIAACEEGPGSSADLVKILRTLIRQVGLRMTPATWKEVDQLAGSDKLSEDQKKTLAEDKAQMRTVEFK